MIQQRLYWSFIALIIFVITFFSYRLFFFSKNEHEDISVVCTTMMISDVVSELLLGSSCKIITLMGPGIDPHTYKVKPSDVLALFDSKCIFYNGLHLEGKMGDVLDDLKKERSVICVSDCLDRQLLIQSGHKDIYDPHIWHDIYLWRQIVGYLYEQIKQNFPELIELITKNYVRYQKKLDETIIELDEIIACIPLQKRVLITAHDAFHYFGKRYNFLVLGLQGLSTESDIGIRDIQNLAELIVEKDVYAIFPESCISPRNIIALQQTVAYKKKEIVIGKELYSDSLSVKNGNAGTYIAMMLYNLKTIVHSLIQEK